MSSRTDGSVNLLVAEDSEDDARLAVRTLKRGGFDVAYERVESAAAMKEALARGGWDAVISDYRMPGFTGLDALEVFKASGLDLPFILISGTIGEQLAVEAMKAGASDYVMKNDLARLAPALKRELKEVANRAARRQTEQALAESEQRLRTIVATEPECVKVVSAEGRLLEMNAAGLAMLEADSLAAVQERPLLDYLLPEHRAGFVALHQRVMRGESGTLEFEIEGLKGGRRWLETHAAPLPGVNGKDRMLLGITRDITERRNADRAQREAAQLLDSIVENIPTAVQLKSVQDDFRIVRWNKAAEEMYGVPREAAIGRNVHDMWPKPDADSYHAADLELVAGGRIQEFLDRPAQTKDRGEIRVHMRKVALRDAGGNATHLLVIGDDITERKRRERELQQFRMTMDVSPDSIYITDAVAMRFVYANEAACLRVGYSMAQLLEMGPQDLLEGGRAQADREYAEVLAAGDHDLMFERVFEAKDGSKGWTELHRRSLRIDDRTLVVTMGRDVTERKRADQLVRLEHAVTRALASSDSVLGTVESVLQAICETERWECSRYFYLDQKANVLRFGVAWAVPEANAQRFIAGWRDVTYTPNVGLPGHVWQTAQPLWVADGDKDLRASRPKLGRDTGMHSAFLFPILSEGKTIGVMAFNSSRIREPDERLLQATGAIGSQIGQFLQRNHAEQVMRESEERFRSLTSLSSDWFWQTDTEHRFIDTPARDTAITGMTKDDYVGLRRWEVEGLLPESGDWTAHRQALEKRETYRDLVLVQTRPDGTRCYLQINGEPVTGPDGNFAGYRGTAKDITGQKQADDRIRRLNRVYAVLSGINAAIVRIGERDELFSETCRIAVAQGEFGIAQIVHVDEDAHEVWSGPIAGIDTLPAWRASFRPGAETMITHGTTFRALRERKPAFVNDISAEPQGGVFRAEALRRGFRSVISLPITVGERIVAMLLLSAREKDFFNDEELRLLGELAGDVSFALDALEKAERLQIETAERLRAETRVVRLNRVYAMLSGINATIVRVENREDLFKEACRIAVEAGNFLAAWIGIVDRGTNTIGPVAWHGLDDDYLRAMPVQKVVETEDSAPGKWGLAPLAIMQRKPMVVADMATDPRVLLRKEAQERGFRSLAMLPLVVSGEAVGVLALYAAEAGFFDDGEMKLLNELAGDIAFALDHIEKANRLDYLAYYDALTGLANRSLFYERLRQYVQSAQQRDEGKLALALLDVERFKTINDSLGRQAGDELLKQLATRLAQATETGNVARIGIDHFAIVLPVIKGRSEATRTVERIWRECFAQSFQVNGTELRITAKSGIALYPSDGADAETLYARAESALQKAKETGERHVFHSSELTAGVANQFAFENRLRLALENDEFVLHYQPKIDSETRQIAGVEALIRWQSPELGLVPPMKFIPLMEESGLILEVGAWALKRAALDHRNWVEQGLKPPRVAVNVSAIQLRQRDFVASVEQAIIEGVAPTGIDLEITESLIMEDVKGSIAKLQAVRDLGVRIAIDDFGTGYSSLAYLAKLPVQTLKIDRSFVITMLNSADTMMLVQTVISLAHSLRLKVVAEGVDAEEQAKMLRLLRCDEMQGYLFSKPVPFDEMTALLRK